MTPRTLANSDGTMVQADGQINSTLETTDLAPEESSSSSSGCFPYAPHDQTSQTLMAAFFTEQYQYHMVVYREYFLRDYDVGSGRYYSVLLLYSMCSLSALLYDDFFKLSDVFSGQAQALLFATLDKSDLTTLQALILPGHREIAAGQTSKGGLFCGMAFRVAHEMGFYLDPSNWEVCKIIHVMIADLFENRRGDVDPAIAAAKSHKIHVSPTKWLASLPGTLHWNQ
ncbi:hypothetical protein J3458_002854 [Metarhizium acridum]|uniref:uncharacterized protein n=1 Tax=Metarhizium acridum TaxID=92637 RepID=UPI001C6C71E9|nr:hypothetical protein J3458_002854 [Metarhizium acridum]